MQLNPPAPAPRSRYRWQRFGQGLSQRQREELTAYLFIAPWLIGFLIFTLGAMLFSLGLSFFKTDLLTTFQFIGLDNYSRLWTDRFVGQALKVTSIYTFTTVPLGTVLALAIALLLNQDVRWRGLFRTIYYLPSIVSGVAVAILWQWIYHPDFGLINALLAWIGIDGPRWLFSRAWALPALILMTLWSVGGNMLIFLAGLQGVPTELYDAAHVDGANGWRRFWHVTLPMLTPTLFFTLILSIIGSYQVFTTAYVMTEGGPGSATLMLVLLLYRVAFEQFKFGYASAIAWLLFGIILAFTLMVIRSSSFWVYYAGEERN
jgi:multiple sugar transport system permease protein